MDLGGMSSNQVVFRFTISSLALLALLPIAVAQTTGSIEGTVTDPSGAPVPKASVKITQRQTGVVTTRETNPTGYYLAENLDPGLYDISVNQKGFKTFLVHDIILDIATQVRRDVTLTIGNLSDSVTVQADAVQVQTSSGTDETVITRDQISTAVLNGRNYERLAMLVPGAVYNSGSDELFNAGLNAPGSPVSINGLSSLSSGWFVDGAYDVNVGNGNANTHVPVIDTIEELQVQTSNYSARYGTTGGSVINAVTRSGTKLFHASAYEYFRNSAMDARNFFSPTVSPVKQNQYGFTFGGPVILPHYNKDRNKTFFFYSEDWRNRETPALFTTATPTQAMRAGDFSAEAARLGLPILDPNTKAPFANNQIPVSRVDPNAALLLSTYFPLPNYSAQGTFNNYINNGVVTLKPRTDTGRLDHNVNDNIRLSLVISHDDINVLSADIAEELPASFASQHPPAGSDYRPRRPGSGQHHYLSSDHQRGQLRLQAVSRQPAVAGQWGAAGASLGTHHQGFLSQRRYIAPRARPHVQRRLEQRGDLTTSSQPGHR